MTKHNDLRQVSLCSVEWRHHTRSYDLYDLKQTTAPHGHVGPVVKASASTAPGLGSTPAFTVDICPGRIIQVNWGRNSSLRSAWARCPQRRGFDPPLGTFSGRGDFSLGVNMGSNSIPPKTLSDESINRGLVCAHMHFIARTQKILTFMS